MTIIRDLDALDEIREAWWDLWRRDARATPFQSPAWLLDWHRAFAPGPLHVVALWRGETLSALAPFYIETHTQRLLPVGISLSDNLDILAEDASAAQALVRQVLSETPCARVELENMPTQAHVRELSDIEGWACRETQNEVCPFLPLGPTWDTHVPARKRRQWRRAVREAMAHGDMRIETITESPQGFLDHLARLHRARWETRAQSGLLADETAQTFHRLAAPELLRAGLARFYLLHFAGQVTGAYYGLAAKGRAYAYIGGFDPAFAHESPGTILLGHAMAQAHEEGVRRFEFLRGGEAYKYAWGARDEAVYRRIWERRA
jgi:CelD/BcsL family acetyltransferase involved in cellulose biosynthesis